MTLRLVTENEKPPEDKGPDLPPASPNRRGRRLLLIAIIAVLVVLGALMLGLSLYVGKQAEGFELTLQFGARTTHVVGTNVTLTEGAHESKCVLSLLDFRALREHSRGLLDATPLEAKAARGAPVFTISVDADGSSVVNSGPLAKETLEPIDAFVIQKASACIETYVAKGPVPVQ